MLEIDINAFRAWQLNGNRSVKVELGNYHDPFHAQVFVYDYDLEVGQLVNTVADIDLVSKKREMLKAAVKELEEFNRG